MTIPCKNCGKLAESKNRHYVLCETCMKAYLFNLEQMAIENNQKAKKDQLKKKEYHMLYKKIERAKERLIDIPRLQNEKTYNRNCLKCDKSFEALGKFNRVCEGCKSLISTIEDYYI